jgi:twitching motility protein PilU
MTADESKEIAYSLMNEHQIKLFDTNLSVGLGVSIPKLCRFRVSVFRQWGSVALVIRNIH